jgi:hypothetical protein
MVLAAPQRQRADDAIANLEFERQRNAALAAKLRELGIDPDAS